jgi:polyhydroxyalkanoate synthesis regulator phasin
VARSGREQYLQSLASLSELTKTQAERVAALLAKQGEVQSAQVGRVAEDLMRRTQKNREIMSRLVQREVKRQLGVLGMATRDEVARLHQRVRALEQELERAGKTSPATGSSKATASKATASKATASKATASKSKAASAGSKTTRSAATGTRRAKAAKPKSSGDGGG